MSLNRSSFYAILNVASNATTEEIKKAYKKLALQFHPDKNHSISAANKFKQIQEAYETLSDPEKRKKYDEDGPKLLSLLMGALKKQNEVIGLCQLLVENKVISIPEEILISALEEASMKSIEVILHAVIQTGGSINEAALIVALGDPQKHGLLKPILAGIEETKGFVTLKTFERVLKVKNIDVKFSEKFCSILIKQETIIPVEFLLRLNRKYNDFNFAVVQSQFSDPLSDLNVAIKQEDYEKVAFFYKFLVIKKISLPETILIRALQLPDQAISNLVLRIASNTGSAVTEISFLTALANLSQQSLVLQILNAIELTNGKLTHNALEAAIKKGNREYIVKILSIFEARKMTLPIELETKIQSKFPDAIFRTIPVQQKLAKMPQAEFDKLLMELTSIASTLGPLHKQGAEILLQMINPSFCAATTLDKFVVTINKLLNNFIETQNRNQNHLDKLVQKIKKTSQYNDQSKKINEDFIAINSKKLLYKINLKLALVIKYISESQKKNIPVEVVKQYIIEMYQLINEVWELNGALESLIGKIYKENNLNYQEFISNYKKTITDLGCKFHPLIDEWHKLEDLTKKLLSRYYESNKEYDSIFSLRETPFWHQNLAKAEDLIKEYNQLHNSLIELAGKLSHTDHSKLELIRNKLPSLKSDVFSQLIKTKKITADWYVYKYKIYDSIGEKLKSMENAKKLLDEIMSSISDQTEIVLEKNIIEQFKGSIEYTLRFVNSALKELQPKEYDIRRKELLDARTEKNVENSYDKFADVLTQEGNDLEKFNVLFHQGYDYADKTPTHLGVIKHNDDLLVFKKLIQPLIFAAQIVINTKTITPEMFDKSGDIYNLVIQLNGSIITFVKFKCHLDVDVKLNILKDVESSLDTLKKLFARLKSSENINSIQAYILEKISIFRDIDSTTHELNELKNQLKTRLEEQQSRELKKSAIVEYQTPQQKKNMDDRMNELVILFEQNKNKPKPKYPKGSKPSKPIVKTTNSQDFEEEDDEIDENIIWQVNLPSNSVIEKSAISSINVAEQNALLVQAKENNDYISQLKLNTILSEHFLIQGSNQHSLNDLEVAQKYIDDADQSLSQAKILANDPIDFMHLEKGISMVLENIKGLINQIYSHDLYKAMVDEDNHARFKEWFIEEFGIEKWFAGNKLRRDAHAAKCKAIDDNLDKLELMIEHNEELLKQYNIRYTFHEIKNKNNSSSSSAQMPKLQESNQLFAIEPMIQPAISNPPMSTAVQATPLQNSTITPDQVNEVQPAQAPDTTVKPLQVTLPVLIREVFSSLKEVEGECYLVGSAIHNLLNKEKIRIDQDVDLVFFRDEKNKFNAKHYSPNPHKENLYNSRFRYTSIDCYVIPVQSTKSQKELIELDAQGRDFTIACLYCDKNGVIIDPTGKGLEDFKNKILRTVIDAETTFKNNPMSLLRAIKFIRKGYKPTPEVENAIRNWTNNGKLDMPHLQAIVRNLLLRYTPNEQIKYVNELINYGLLKKIFDIDTQDINQALTELKTKVGVRSVTTQYVWVPKQAEPQQTQVTTEKNDSPQKIDVTLESTLADVQTAVLRACSHPSKAQDLLHSVNAKVKTLLKHEKYAKSFFVRVYNILTSNVKTVPTETFLSCFREYTKEEAKYLQSVSASEFSKLQKYLLNLLNCLLATYYAKNPSKYKNELVKLLRDSHANLFFNLEGADLRELDLSNVCLEGSNIKELQFSGTITTAAKLTAAQKQQFIVQYKKELHACPDDVTKLKIVKKMLLLDPQNADLFLQKLYLKYQIYIADNDWASATLIGKKILNDKAIDKNIWQTKSVLLKGISLMQLGQTMDALTYLNQIILDPALFNSAILKESPNWEIAIKEMINKLLWLSKQDGENAAKIIGNINFIKTYFPDDFKKFVPTKSNVVVPGVLFAPAAVAAKPTEQGKNNIAPQKS